MAAGAQKQTLTHTSDKKTFISVSSLFSAGAALLDDALSKNIEAGDRHLKCSLALAKLMVLSEHKYIPPQQV